MLKVFFFGADGQNSKNDICLGQFDLNLILLLKEIVEVKAAQIEMIKFNYQLGLVIIKTAFL